MPATCPRGEQPASIRWGRFATNNADAHTVKRLASLSRATIQHYQARYLSSTQFRRTLPTREPYLASGRPPPSACAHAQVLARRSSWWLPGDLAAFASSPPGKKNSRGAPPLRQIELGYNLLQQVRRGVTERRQTRTASPVRRGHPETVLGCVLSRRDLPCRQSRQTPPGTPYLPLVRHERGIHVV